MKRSIDKVVAIMWVAVAVTTMLAGVANGRLVYVGGKIGWKEGVNYTEWASNQSIYVNDWIGFKFVKTQYDVVEVNETGYTNCNNDFMINNITNGGGNDVYQLNETKTYYFICTKGYCWGGMKVAVNVTLPPPPPAPSPSGNYASSIGTTMPLVILAMSILFGVLTSV